MNPDMISYYKDRAKEYENIYKKPERQNDLLIAEKMLQDIFADRTVFEIACGTGYWTEKIAATAKYILATDINETAVNVAKSKNYARAKVDFQIKDIFSLTNITKNESLFGGFIWSHIKLQDLKRFINIVNNLVQSGGTVAFMDNNYIAGSSLPVSDEDDSGNTYQTRTLENGTTHKVIKNFPSEIFMRQLLADTVSEINFIQLQYYWILKYKNL